MTETRKEAVKPLGQSGKFYPLTPAIAAELRGIAHLPAAGWRLWSYLATFDPFGDEYQELPPLKEILSECNVSKSTFYRVIALFQEEGLFDLEIGQLRIKNLRGSRIVPKIRQDSQKWESNSQNWENQSQKWESNSQNWESTKNEIPDTRGFEGNGNVPITDQSNLKNNKTVPPAHPVLEEDRDNLGTRDSDPLTAEISKIAAKIQEAGIRPNKTIQGTIATIIFQESPAAAARAVENAISALREQQAKGSVKNPGGFLNSALRRNFTANHAKVTARERRTETLDLSTTIAAIDVHCSGLGISRQQAITQFLGSQQNLAQLSDPDLITLEQKLRRAHAGT